MKKVNDIIDYYKLFWNEQSSLDSYSYVDKCIEFNKEYLRIIKRFEKSKNYNEKKYVAIYALNATVYKLYNEIIKGFLVKQQIATQTLARAIIENYITLVFLDRFGEEAFKVYYADSQIKKIKQAYRRKLTTLQKKEYESQEKSINNKFNKYTLGKDYAWTKTFIHKNKKDNGRINLYMIAKKLELIDSYNLFILLSDATHSKELYTHDLNNFRVLNSSVYTIPLYIGLDYLYKIAKLSFEPTILIKLKILHTEMEEEFVEKNNIININ